MKLEIECQCGKLRGVANTQGLKGYRAICLCDDCRAFAHFLAQAKDVLDVNGGTDIFPMTPAKIKFTHGVENLKSLMLTSKGMVRWFASCCKTPIANTPASTKIPYVGVIHSVFDKKNSVDTLTKNFG